MNQLFTSTLKIIFVERRGGDNGRLYCSVGQTKLELNAHLQKIPKKRVCKSIEWGSQGIWKEDIFELNLEDKSWSYLEFPQLTREKDGTEEGCVYLEIHNTGLVNKIM